MRLKRIIKKHALLAILSIILIFLTIIFSVYGLMINEVMFNPQGSDTGREYIELYDENISQYNLSQYKLYEGGSNHNILLYHSGNDSSYAVLCTDCNALLLEYPELNSTSLYTSAFSLSNTGEEIILKSNESMRDSLNYSIYPQYFIEGYSLELCNSTWNISAVNGSPGSANSCPITCINQTDINQTINSTNSSTNDTSNGTDILNNHCNISIKITFKENKSFYNNKESIKFRNVLDLDNATAKSSLNYSIEYWIEDLFGNIVKSKLITENENEKSYTPSIDENDAVLVLRNRIADLSCNNTAANTASEKYIIVKKSSYADLSCPTCPKCSSSSKSSGSSGSSSSGSSACLCTACDKNNIKNIDKNSSLSINYTESKGNITILASIYKGETDKYLVEMMASDEYNRTLNKYKIRAYTKYSLLDVQLPIFSDDCHENITLIIQGLGLMDSMTIYNNCSDDIKLISVDNGQSRAYSTDNKSLNYSYHSAGLAGELVYESPNQKNKQYSLIGIILLVLAGIMTLAFMAYKRIKQKCPE